MLLWHGSRLTNTVGILSRGLRIAPPEAPTTGYMVWYFVHLGFIVSLYPSLHEMVSNTLSLPQPYVVVHQGVLFVTPAISRSSSKGVNSYRSHML